MTTDTRPREELLAEIDCLHLRMAEAEDTLRAIGNGEVDAFVVSGPDGDQVFTLKGAEHPYRVLVETMNEGAATIAADGTILYCNSRLSSLLQIQQERLIGSHLGSFVAPANHSLFTARLESCTEGYATDEMELVSETGNFIPVLISSCALNLSGHRGISVVVTDLTQQKRNEEVVASERLARSILEQAGEAIVVCDQEGKIIQASRLAQILCGENPLLKFFDDLFRLRIADTGCLFSIVIPLEGRGLESVEVEYRRSDDQAVHLILNATPLRGIGGSIIGCVVTLTDFTELKQADEALRKSEEFNKTVLETVGGLVVVLDREGRIQRFNHACEAATGYCASEVQDRIFWEFLVLKEEMEGIRLTWERLQNGDFPNDHENHWVAKDGSSRLIAWNNTAIVDAGGALQYIVAAGLDITERKQTEAAVIRLNAELEHRVAERTESLAATVDNLRDEIVERGRAEERTRRLNRLYAVLSETNQAIVRTRDRDTLFKDFCTIAVGDGNFKLAWVGLLDAARGEIKTVAADGAIGYLDDINITANEEPPGNGPTGISLREGTYYICNDFLNDPITRPWQERGRAYGIRASASIALKQEGKVIGALTLYADKKDFFDRQQVHLLRQVGADVSFALDNIARETRRQEAERALREETAERLLAVEALREKEQMLIQQNRLAAMGEMIGNIAHQWRQPLNLLGLTAQQLLMFYDMGGFNRTFLAENVDSSMALIQHMSQTIDDFRNFFKPDKERVFFRVQEAISSTLSLMEGSLQSPRINVKIVAQDDPFISGYPNEFKQVVLNLVSNAKDVFAERAVSDARLTITVSSEDDRAVVTVADNAGGIPEEVIGKIFDPYFTTKGSQGGTGIGLFMSRTIIEKNMDGRLSVRNIADGAEFRVEV